MKLFDFIFWIVVIVGLLGFAGTLENPSEAGARLAPYILIALVFYVGMKSGSKWIRERKQKKHPSAKVQF